MLIKGTGDVDDGEAEIYDQGDPNVSFRGSMC